MLDDITLNKKKYMMMAGISICFLLLLGIGYLFMTRTAEHNDQVVSKFDNDIRVKQSTQIEQVYFYTKCKDELVQEIIPNSECIGIEYKSFQQVYPQWNIELFTEDKIRMSLQVNDYCEWHKNNNFIGIHEGRIAIFSGMPDNKPLLREQTMISVDQLHPQALEEIKNGLVFSSKEEMLQFLEGIQSK